MFFKKQTTESVEVGDYVIVSLEAQHEKESAYFRVEKIVLINRLNPESKQKELVNLLLLKKVLSAKFECKNLMYLSTHPVWCTKVSDSLKKKIDSHFLNKPNDKKKVDEFAKPETSILGKAIVCNNNEKPELDKSMQKISSLALTVEEIESLPIIKVNLFEQNLNKRGKVYDVVFLNSNLETNSKNELVYRLRDYNESKFRKVSPENYN